MSLNSKAQAGLEYLMTYGWALVLIVTVAGVLFFVMAPPTNNFVCKTSQPEKIVLKQYNMPFSPNFSSIGAGPHSCGNVFGDYSYCKAWGATAWCDPPGEMILQNGTGGDITITSIESEQIYQEPETGCDYYKVFSPASVNGVKCNSDTFGNSGSGTTLGACTPENKYFNNCSNISNISVVKGGQIKMTSELFILRNSVVSGCDLSDTSFASTHTFTINYNDQFGYGKSVDVICQGSPPTS